MRRRNTDNSWYASMLLCYGVALLVSAVYTCYSTALRYEVLDGRKLSTLLPSANILFFCLGATITWIAPITTKLENTTDTIFHETVPANFIPWVTFLPALGASISAYFYTYLADVFGRKLAIISLGMPYLLPYLLMGLRTTVKTYLIARFVLGLAMGGTFSVLPIYAGEISSKHNRATLNSIGGVTLAAGALFSYVLGPFVSLSNFNLTLATFPAVFLVLFLIFGEETAHYYLFKNEEVPARKALMKLRGLDVDQVMENIQNIIKEQSEYSQLSFIQKKVFIKNFTSVVGLLIFQQITGMNAVLMFNETIFELTESHFDSDVCCVVVGIVQFFSSLFVLTYEEKFGRKTLLITSALTMSVLLTILGIHCILLAYNIYYLKLLPLIVLSLFIVSYFIGIGPIPFVIMSETLPWRVKSIAVSIITTIYWFTVLIIIKFFPYMINTIGLGSCFLGLALLCIFSVIFVYFCLEETKGKTFEEIQLMFRE